MEQPKFLSGQILSQISTELQYIKRSIFMKGVSTRNFWTFELRTQEGIDVPIWIIVVFQRRDR